MRTAIRLTLQLICLLIAATYLYEVACDNCTAYDHAKQSNTTYAPINTTTLTLERVTVAIVELRVWDLKVFKCLRWTFLNHVEYILMGLLIVVLYYQIKKVNRKSSQLSTHSVIEKGYLTPEQHKVQAEQLTHKEVDKLINSPEYKQYLADREGGKCPEKEGLEEDLAEFNAQHAANEALIFDQ